MTNETLVAMLASACKESGAPFDVMRAIITVESSWDTWAIRYEQGSSFLNDPRGFSKKNKISYSTEKELQKFSWGLGQVMGATARDLGYVDNLTKLVNPAINLRLACLYFINRCSKYGTIEAQIASYNAGSPQYADKVLVNQGYVDKVLKIMAVD